MKNRIAIAWLLLSVALPVSGLAQTSVAAPVCVAGSEDVPGATPFAEVAKVIERWTLPDDGPNAVFGVRSLDFTEDGHALIADSRNDRVLLFDAEFKTAEIIGGQGEGPGEYSKPRQAAFSADASISILDYSLARAALFSATGTFIRFVRMPTSDSRRII